MELGIIIGVVVSVAVIVALGGGVGYIIWITTRSKKMSWKARIYQLSDGVLTPEKDDKGKAVINYTLSDLKEYATDVVMKIDKKDGATHYWLQKMKKAVPVVTADCVEVWGEKDKWVSVLLEGDTTTLLKTGYDRTLGQKVFRPMPHDRINMIKTETSERKARIDNTKDILAQITPFVVVGISMLALVTIVYFAVQGGIKIAELFVEGAGELSDQLASFRTAMLQTQGCFLGETPVITQEEPPTIPP